MPASAGLQVQERHRDDHLRDVINKRMEETRPETREPVHLFDGMMPGMGPPHNRVVMLGPVNPVEYKVHHEQADDNFCRAREALQMMQRARQKRRCEIDRQPAQEPVRNPIHRQGKGKGKDIQF